MFAGVGDDQILSMLSCLNARLHVCDFETIKKNKNKIANTFIVADMDGENVNTIKPQKEKIAVIVGNEGQGVSDTFKEKGHAISLPMKSQMESLNAGVSASVLMYVLLGTSI